MVKLIITLISGFVVVLFSSFTTLPFVISAVVVLYSFYRGLFLFVFAFTMGIVLDAFSAGEFGRTSLFLVLFLFVAILYERKFEINTLYFVFVAACVGSILYLLFFGYSSVFEQSLVVSISASVSFVILNMLFRQKKAE